MQNKKTDYPSPVQSLFGSLSLTDGTRLENRTFKGSDGSVVYAGVYDKELNSFCYFGYSSLSNPPRRCYPSQGIIYYLRSDCSDNGFLVYPSPSLIGSVMDTNFLHPKPIVTIDSAIKTIAAGNYYTIATPGSSCILSPLGAIETRNVIFRYPISKLVEEIP